MKDDGHTLSLPSAQNASVRSFDDAELDSLRAVLASGPLTVTKGTFAKQLERRFADLLGLAHAFTCNSGTAAVHAAIAALDPEAILLAHRVSRRRARAGSDLYVSS